MVEVPPNRNDWWLTFCRAQQSGFSVVFYWRVEEDLVTYQRQGSEQSDENQRQFQHAGPHTYARFEQVGSTLDDHAANRERWQGTQHDVVS